MTLMIRSALLGLALGAVAAGTAFAGPVTLKPNPVDTDGRVTLGDIFDGAGAAADVLVAERFGPSVVLDAGQLQAQAARAGLSWGNPTGLRRIAVRRADLASADPSAPIAPAVATAPHAFSVRAGGRPVAAAPIIARNDMVRVTYEVGGVRLSIMGRAMRAAAIGDSVAVMNLDSNRIIDAVATGPGQAVTGPAAEFARAATTQQFAAR